MSLLTGLAYSAASSCRDQIIDRRTFMEVELEAESQSRVGKKLTELTIRKVGGCLEAASVGLEAFSQPQLLGRLLIGLGGHRAL